MTIELVAFGIKVLDQGYENVLTVEVLKRVENIDGSRDSTAGIEIPKGKTRKQTLMEIFDLRALRVGPDMEPDVIKLMEQILLSGVRGSGVRNDHIASRILKLRTVDGHAAYRLNRVFSIAREPTNPTNLRYRPTAQLRKLFEQRRIGSVITQYVDLIAASTGIARGDVIEYVLFAYENETEAAISAARSELIRRGFER